MSWWSRAVARQGAAVAAFEVLVVLAAGGSAVALLGWPGSTGTYFSWRLRPPAAAGAIGGLYLSASVLFGWALTLTWPQARPLFVGVLGLTTPTFVLTLVFDEVFDFGRWQALVWVVLFAGAPVAAALILALRPTPSTGPPLRTWSRGVLAGLAVVLGALAIAIWFDRWREDVSEAGPFDLVGLTGGYLGAWCSFAAALCGWAAVRNRWDDARLALVALGLAAVGFTVALLRSVGDLRQPALAVAASIAVALLAAATYTANRPS